MAYYWALTKVEMLVYLYLELKLAAMMVVSMVAMMAEMMVL